MDILFSPYTLQRTDGSLPQAGTLVKVVAGADWGVADLCPRLELEDSDYQNEIIQLGSLYRRAVDLAKEDLEARQEKRSLLLDEPIFNNILVTNYQTFNFSSPNLKGHILKIKGDTEVEAFAAVLNSLPSELRLRLDFNSRLNELQFQQFLDLLTPETIEKIEYVEDPTPFNQSWMRWNKKVNLAFDFQQDEYLSEYAKHRIIKPVREAMPMRLGDHYTLTSAMDHPVGLAHGLRIAQADQRRRGHPVVGGFLTLDLYTDIGFRKYFRQQENILNFSPLALKDTGIGMTDELNKLKWIKREEVLRGLV